MTNTSVLRGFVIQHRPGGRIVIQRRPAREPGYRVGVAAPTGTSGGGAPRPGPEDLRWRFATSGGPGGQHANRTETRVELTFDVGAARCLDAEQRRRVRERHGDVIVVACDETRSQWRNREIAYERLCERIAAALVVTPRRVATRPRKGAQQRRLQAKRRRGETKSMRRRPDAD